MGLQLTGLAARESENLLDFTRRRRLQTETVNIDLWLAELLGEMQWPEGLERRWQLASGVTVAADPERLRRALINVISNALQAMEENRASGQSQIDILGGFTIFIFSLVVVANINWLIRFKGFYKLAPERALACAIPEGIHLSPEAVAEAFAADNPTTVLAELLRRRYPGLTGLLAPGEAVESYTRLVMIERILAEILLLEVRHLLSGYPFTIGILLAYFVLKSAEIRRIMTTLNAKFYDWPEERIMAAL